MAIERIRTSDKVGCSELRMLPVTTLVDHLQFLDGQMNYFNTGFSVKSVRANDRTMEVPNPTMIHPLLCAASVS